MLSRNPQFFLNSWDRDSGFGLLVARDRSDSLVLSPLALVLLTFSDGPFTRGDAVELLEHYEKEGSTRLRQSVDPVLDAMLARGALVDSEHPLPAESHPAVPPLNSIYLYITYRCNLRCYHCYQRPEFASFEHTSRAEELPAAVLVDAIREALPLGVRSVKITGGEPFMRADADELLLGLASLGLHLTMESNGTLIDARRAELLARCGVGVSVSIDGSTAERHDALRGVPGSFAKTFRGIANLLASGVEVKVITAVSRRNVEDIDAICALVSSAGVRHMKINPVNTLGVAGVAGIEDDLLPASEVQRLYARLRDGELEKRYGIDLFLEGPPSLFTLEDVARGKCGSCPFLNILGILSNGEVSFCGIGYSEPELRFGRIPDVDIASLWREQQVIVAAREAIPGAIGGICSQCALLPRCHGSCRALAYQKEKSFTSPHPWCQELAEQGTFPRELLLERESVS